MNNMAVPCCSSDYLKGLEEEDKKHYLNRLTLSDCQVLPDPWAIKDWKQDILMLPNITFGDIYTRLIQSSS